MPLHPEIKQMLEQLSASDWKEVSTLTPKQAREQSRYFAGLRVFPKPLPDIRTTDFYISTKDKQNILLRLYESMDVTPQTIIVFYHGGGFGVGSVDQYDTVCRWMASDLNVLVISVGYRLAPEYTFPTQIEDAYAALEWVDKKRNHLKTRNLVVAGDSAGGYLATMASMLARDKHGPHIDWQWLIYPWVDNDFSRLSFKNYGEGFPLSTETIKWYATNYLGKNPQKSTYPFFPMHAANFHDLPKTYIISAECDALYDEVVAYAETLVKADNSVHYECIPGVIHGFLNQYSVPVSFNATTQMFERFKELLHSE